VIEPRVVEYTEPDERLEADDGVDPGESLESDESVSSGGSEAEDGQPAERPGELTEAALEALLFVAERPLSRREIGTLARVDPAVVDARLGDLEVSLAARGIRLVTSGERVELATAADAGELIARYVGAEAVPRLSHAALETLAIVAYGQPITRSGIERIRGVDSDYTVRALLHRRLVVELGRSETPGRPYVYGTGFDFLERFGLTSLVELPPLDMDAAAQIEQARGEQAGRTDAATAAESPDAAAAEDEPAADAADAAGE
jgi:segregation and condensation protein B